MGSIAVALAQSPRAAVEAVNRALSAAPHRGTTIATANAASLAAGVSVSNNAADAWLAKSDGRIAVFTGTLDNATDLERELRSDGAGALSDPAEIALAAFSMWGDHAPARFRGAFAGAIADSRDETVRCFRDHLGFRTLFIHKRSDLVVAASEAKQVAAGARIRREADPDAVADVLYGRLPEHATALRSVERVPKASVLVAHPGGVATSQRFWFPADLVETARMSTREVGERLAALLEQAVARTITGSDAVSLSGGIDSPTVAALAAPLHLQRAGRPILAVSSVYPDLPEVDETRYIRLIAERLELPLETYVPTAGPLDNLDSWVDILDGPWDTLLVPEVAEHYRLVRDLGATTVLGGDLAEYVYTMHQHVIGHLLLHGRWRSAASWARANRRYGRSRWQVARRALASTAPKPFAGTYVRLRGRDYRELPRWIDRAEADGGSGPRPDLEIPARRRWRQAQIDPVGPGVALTIESDEITAAVCGVDVRRPLADIDLWEFFLSLPAEQKFPDFAAKGLIRAAMRGRLPDEVLDRRRKTVFDAHVIQMADYAGLRRWIFADGGGFRIRGVDYDALRVFVERRELRLFELIWANDLARAHAFLARFG